jgi:hypothetical protein
MVRQNIMVEGNGRVKLLTSWQPESRKRGRSREQGISFQGTSKVTRFPQLNPTFHGFTTTTSQKSIQILNA